MTDLPLDQIRTLLAVVDEGTFDAAAQALHVTPSAISQRVKALEQRTGRVLLLRSKPVRLTESGEVVVRFARQLARLERDASAELGLGDTGEPTTLSVAVNADSLATWFLPALSAVPAELRVTFDLHREDQDHTTQLLRQGRVLAAVTSSPEPVQGCSVRRLGRMRYRAMAAPGFVARWLADGPLRQALPQAPVVIFDRKDDLQDRFLRELAPRSGSGAAQHAAQHAVRHAAQHAAQHEVQHAARHYVPASEAYIEAVAAGLGWGMIPDLQAGTRRAGGALVDLAADRPIDIPLYWQQWRLDSPVLAALTDAVLRTAAEALPDAVKLDM